MKQKFTVWIESLYNKAIRPNKIKIFWFTAVLLLAVLIICFLIINKIPNTFYQEKVELLSKVILLVLQFVGLLLIFLFVVAMIRSLMRKKEGYLYLPFDVPIDDKTNSGKAIVDALIAEKHRLRDIVGYLEYEENEENDLIVSVQLNSGTIKENEDKLNPLFSDPNRLTQKPQKSELKHLENQLNKPTPKERTTSSQNPENNKGSISIKVGETSLSLTQILADVKTIWNDIPPLFTMTGSLQNCSEGMKLIVRREGIKTEVLEAMNISTENLIKEMALKLVIADREIKTPHDIFRKYIDSYEHYRHYKSTKDENSLKNAWSNLKESIGTDYRGKYEIKLMLKLFLAYCMNPVYDEIACEIGEWIINSQGEINKLSYLAKKTHANFLICFGLVCKRLNKYPEAEKSYIEAMRCNEKNIYSYYCLTLLYSSFKDLEGLKILYSKNFPDALKSKIKATICKALEKNEVSFNKIGEWYQNLNLNEEAKEAYQRAIIDNNNKDIDIIYKIGNAYLDMKYYESSIELFHDAIKLGENKVNANYLANIYNNMATSYDLIETSREYTDNAIKYYKKAIENDPLLAIAYSNLGIIYERNGELEDARDFYSSAHKLDPEESNFIIQLVLIYNKLDDNRKAIELIKPYVDKFPGLHSILSSIYGDQEELGNAVEESNKAIKLEPEDPYCHRNLGYIYIGQGKIEMALAEFEESLRLAPDLRYTHAAKAGCFKRLHKSDKYEEEVKIATQLEVELGETEYNQASFEALCGRANEAVKFLEIAINKRQHTRKYIKNDIDFDFIRKDPDFIKLTYEN